MGDWTPREIKFSELGKRLASAALMIPFGVWIVWQGGLWLAVGCAFFAAIMAYEWAQMSGLRDWWPLSLVAALMPILVWFGSPWIIAAGVLLGCFIAVLTAWRDRAYERPASVAIFGFLYVSLLAVGLVLLRAGPWHGVWAALLVMSFVWASDAGAYFVGRSVGGPKLLARESPNKTWAGAIGAVIVSAICGVAAAFLLKASPGAWVAVGITVSVGAQVGDMFESGCKRRLGVKDSSNLVPGHGGVLDRVDGLGVVCGGAAAAFAFIPGLTQALGLV